VRLFEAVEIPSEEPVSHVGVYVIKWHERPEQPELGFIPVGDPPEPYMDVDAGIGEFLRQYQRWYKSLKGGV